MLIAWFIAGFLCANWSVWTLLVTSVVVVVVTASSMLAAGSLDLWSVIWIVAALVLHQAGYFASILFRVAMPGLHAQLSYRLQTRDQVDYDLPEAATRRASR